MVWRIRAWRKATSGSQALIGKRLKSGNCPAVTASNSAPVDNASPYGGGKALDLSSLYASVSQVEKQKRNQDRDFLVSVLSATATKRDAKQYLQTFGSAVQQGVVNAKRVPVPPGADDRIGSIPLYDGIRAVSESPRFIQGPRRDETSRNNGEPHLAIIKFRDPEWVNDSVLSELVKTFAQLRALGLPSIIAIECESTVSDQLDWLDRVTRQVFRIARALDQYGEPLTSVIELAIAPDAQPAHANSPFTSGRIFIDLQEHLKLALEEGAAVVIPPYAVSTDTSEAKLVNTNDVVLALTRFLSGLQFSKHTTADGSINDGTKPERNALVDRIIVLDSLGGPPAKERPEGARVFLNMEEEYNLAMADIEEMKLNPADRYNGRYTPEMIKNRHKENLELARNTLAILPSTSSALVTTPVEAANLQHAALPNTDGVGVLDYAGSVGTRRSQNPLIHNLLTDRPIYSSSLPLGRIKSRSTGSAQNSQRHSRTTLVKRGMPVTIYPDPHVQPWVPPRPGGPRLRLTDTCVDMARLTHLIDDSFNRKLDVQHYLDRVNENLAGIIVAGEYEGGAILTWERPFGQDEETAYASGRLVPYLDKFAVLKKSQGAGGVADIVFNAMVRDCFPDGVCWRSRKTNPVNKWYFERSRGTWKLDGSNWTMFWTTPWSALGKKRIWDYEHVCRTVVPSWADNKTAPD